MQYKHPVASSWFSSLRLIAVSYEIHLKSNVHCVGRTYSLVNVKAGGTYSYHRFLEDNVVQCDGIRFKCIGEQGTGPSGSCDPVCEATDGCASV